MPFISTYNGAMQMLGWIESGRCAKTCRSSWLRNFKYALKTPTNPLKLTAVQRKTMKARIASLSGKRITAPVSKTRKNRPSPSISAAENCGKTAKGNDGNMYKSVADKNGVCRWKKF